MHNNIGSMLKLNSMTENPKLDYISVIETNYKTNTIIWNEQTVNDANIIWHCDE